MFRECVHRIDCAAVIISFEIDSVVFLIGIDPMRLESIQLPGTVGRRNKGLGSAINNDNFELRSVGIHLTDDGINNISGFIYANIDMGVCWSERAGTDIRYDVEYFPESTVVLTIL